MSERAVTGDGPRPPAAEPSGTEEISMDLDVVQAHVLSLLDQLDRPPRAVRVQAGEVVLDISWPETVSITTGLEQVAETVTHLDEIPDPAFGDGQAEAASAEQYLTAPSVGVFYHCSGPGAEPFVSVGSQVKIGQQIGIIEAMKLMIPIEADRDGTIINVLKGNGQPVEYAERLFVLTAATTEG